MRLTAYTDYTLRTLIYLALNAGRQATIAQIADTYRISEAHLTKVAHQLGVAGEIETSLAFLAYLRQGVSRKLDGLTEDQVRRALVPSGTSLLGLVKHLTEVEAYWIQRRFAGLDVPLVDDGFSVTPDDTVASVRRAYAQEGITDEIC